MSAFKCVKIFKIHLQFIYNFCCDCLPASYDNDLSLCLFAWETWNCSRTYTHLALFDLNQWYKEEMPNTGRSTYMAVFDLDAPLAGKTQKLLDVKIDENSLQPYRCDTNQEEHYHPSALAFGKKLLLLIFMNI